MPARRDQLWQGMFWQRSTKITSGSSCTTLVHCREGKMHFLGEQFQHEKMLPQSDFAAGRFSLAGVQKAATPGTAAEAQMRENTLPIIIRAIHLTRAPDTY